MPPAVKRGRYPLRATVRAFIEDLSGEGELREIRAEVKREEFDKLRLANEHDRGDALPVAAAEKVAAHAAGRFRAAVDRAQIPARDRRRILISIQKVAREYSTG